MLQTDHKPNSYYCW